MWCQQRDNSWTSITTTTTAATATATATTTNHCLCHLTQQKESTTQPLTASSLRSVRLSHLYSHCPSISPSRIWIYTHTYTHTLSLPLPLPFSFSIYPSASAVGRRFGGPGRLQRFKWLRRAAGRKGGAQVGPDGDCGQELSLSLSASLSLAPAGCYVSGPKSTK